MTKGVRNLVISFFGHSDFQPDAVNENSMIEILTELVGDASADFYLGGYGGFDEFAFSCCKRYKKNHKDVNLIFVTPYITLEYQKNRLEYMKREYDTIRYFTRG